MENYDLELKSSGNGWMGTFGLLVESAVREVTEQFEHAWTAEATLSDGTVLIGELSAGFGDGTFRVDSLIIDVNEVIGFRA